MKLVPVLIAICATALITAGTAVGTTLVTGGGIADETITAADLGPAVTRMRTVPVVVASQEAVVEERCTPNEAGEPECGEYVNSAATTITRSVRCASGNVTGGGLKVVDQGDVQNLEVMSYPSSDDTWTYRLHNTGPDDIAVELRVVCV